MILNCSSSLLNISDAPYIDRLKFKTSFLLISVILYLLISLCTLDVYMPVKLWRLFNANSLIFIKHKFTFFESLTLLIASYFSRLFLTHTINTFDTFDDLCQKFLSYLSIRQICQPSLENGKHLQGMKICCKIEKLSSLESNVLNMKTF